MICGGNNLHFLLLIYCNKLLKSMQGIQPNHSQVLQPPSSQQANIVKPAQLKIVTLNYCGIMNNPFQFYCETYLHELQKLSDVFERCVREHFKLEKEDKFKWEMGKIEQKIRLGRYSPSFHLNIGIEEGRFLGKEEFQQRWNEEFQAICEKGQLKFEEIHISNTMTYDFLFYYALLCYVYQLDSFEELIQQDPAKYIANLKKFYDLSYLDDAKKMVIVQNSLLQFEADIIFLQEFSPLFLCYIKDHPEYEHVTDASHDTIIAVKKASFNKAVQTESVLSKQQIESLMWTDKTSIMAVDNIILINAHLNSNKEKNLPQIELLKKSLLRLKQQLPEYHIILGGDLNSFLSPDEEFDKFFHMYPRLSHEITTVKMRTMAQGQFQKANVKTAESKDKIISDLLIVADSAKVSYIDNIHSPEENSYVPTDEHPFDHFLVTCRVALQ